MLIGFGFDESNKARRKRIYQNALRTSEKLNRRLKQATNDIKKNHSLTSKQKKECINKILDGIN